MTDTADTTYQHQWVIAPEHADQRLDAFVAAQSSQWSRNQVIGWIKSADITVNQQPSKPKVRLQAGDVVDLKVVLGSAVAAQPENIPLTVVAETNDFIIINKPAQLVVHPGAGNGHGTLMNALLYHYPELEALPRAGIVHRLDKDTTGLMVIARNMTAYHYFVAALKDRTIKREYWALVYGECRRSQTIDAPMARHPQHRTKMAVHHGQQAKPAVTHVQRLETFKGASWLQCTLETGRTHQIRVHCQHLGHALIGDPLYVTRRQWVAGMSAHARAAITAFNRPALHAHTLSFLDPTTQVPQTFSVPMPDDMVQLKAQLDPLTA